MLYRSLRFVVRVSGNSFGYLRRRCTVVASEQRMLLRSLGRRLTRGLVHSRRKEGHEAMKSLPGHGVGRSMVGLVLGANVWSTCATVAFAYADGPRQDAPGNQHGGFMSDAAPLIGPLVTDRPDFTESTEAVARGHVQLELGYTFTYDRESDRRVREDTAPELLIRAGVADDLELRIGWDGFTSSDELLVSRAGLRSIEDTTEGASDLALGLKLKLVDQEGWRPHFGVIAELSLPVGGAPTTSDDVDPAVSLLWAYDVSDSFSVAGNINLTLPTQEGDRFVQAGASLSVAATLSESLGSYIEYFGAYPASDGADAAHVLNGGFTFLISDNLQFDIRVGFGLTEEAPDLIAGAGFAVRF